MATQIKLTALEQSILARLVASNDGFERVEDIHAALGADDSDFVDALESLESDGYLSVRNLGGAIVVGFEDPLTLMSGPQSSHDAHVSGQLGVC